MKEIMEVLELWFPEGGKYFRKVAAREIEEAFRDLYNQYLVAEKGAVDFFDWLDKRDIPKSGWEWFSVTCGNCDREIKIPYQSLPTDHPDRRWPWDQEVTVKFNPSTGEEKAIYFNGQRISECKECGSIWLTGKEEKPILCSWCRKEPRILGGELCRKCMKHLEDVGATYG